MAKFEFNDMDVFVNLIDTTNANINKVIGKSIYPGAKIMADAVQKAVESIPVDNKRHGSRGKRLGITQVQKDGLLESLGIAKITKFKGTRTSGAYGWNVKVGFDGYNKVVTKKYKKGQPNAMIARSVNSGTSFMQKYPFMDITVSANASAVEQAIAEEFDKQLEWLWGRAK